MIPVEFPRTHIIVPISYSMKSLFWLKRDSARRSVSVVNRKNFSFKWPFLKFVRCWDLIRIWVLLEIFHDLVFKIFIMELKLLHRVSHLTEPKHQTLWCFHISDVSGNARRIRHIRGQTFIFVNVVEKI